jgi:hypothetical protein
MSVEPTVLFIDRDLLVAHWYNLQVVDQGGMMLSHHVRVITEQSQQLAKRYPKMFVCISFLRPGTPISPKPVREELRQMMKETEALQAVTAAVLESTGILASALRTTLRTMAVMSGNHKVKIVGKLEEAIPFILPHVEGPQGLITKPELEAIVAKIRAQYEKQFPQQRAVRP